MIEDKGDIQMSDVSKETKVVATQLPPVYSEYKKVLINLDKALTLKDTKSLILNFRQVNKFRKHFQEEDISFIFDIFLRNTFNFSAIPQLDQQTKESLSSKFNIPPKICVRVKENPEFLLFNFLIIIGRLVDQKRFQEAEDGLNTIVFFIQKNESNTIHFLRAKTFHFYTLVKERLGKFDDIINDLLNEYRKACLELDELSQITLINRIIRYYVLHESYDQARNFISKTKFHENINTNEDSRYFFYLGFINAIQMNYSEAFVNLTNSMRKAPEKCGEDFKASVQKLLIIVELLMGDVPDIRKILTSSLNLKSLKPYFDLIKSVKQGNLKEFSAVILQYEKEFSNDKLYNLIQRLRHVVIKIGLRKINLSYSRISLKDITEKLNLDSEKDCEYIVAKAIRDGVFLAKINHDEGYVQSMEIKDIYSTFEPQKSFQRRILFLNKIHNDSMKAMKYSELKNDKNKRDANQEEDDDDLYGEADGYLDF